MFYRAIFAVMYLAVGFFVCRKCGWYEGLFRGVLFEDLFDRREAMPMSRELPWFILTTVCWAFWLYLAFIVFVLTPGLMRTPADEKKKPESEREESLAQKLASIPKADEILQPKA